MHDAGTIGNNKDEELMADRIPPTSDLGFKKITSEPSNADILQGMAGDFLDLWVPVEKIKVTVPYDIRSYEEYVKRLSGGEEISEKLRQTVQDVVAEMETADFSAELQVQIDAYYSVRSVHYLCSRFCANYNRAGAMKQLADGSFLRYSSLKPVIMLNILGYTHFTGDDDALRIFALYDKKRDKAFDIEYLTLAYFELTKNNFETKNQWHWKTFFKTGEAADDAPEYIKKASRIIEKANLTQKERDMIDQIERAEEIYKNTIYSAQVEGERIGEARGEARADARAEAKLLEIARNALHMGMTIAEVSQLTGKTEDEIRRLAH
jgi:predicted transposase/invertase (TIGR01784 family)